MSLKAKVWSIMETYPEARNDDIFLMCKYYKNHFNTTDLKELRIMSKKGHNVPSPESLRRTRQKIQEEGELLAYEGVRARRRELAEEYRKAKGLPFDEENITFLTDNIAITTNK